MKKFLNYSVLAFLVMLLAASCSKDGGIDDPNPDPDPEPPTGQELKFPGKEMRAVWIATAWGIDWPINNYTQSAQKVLYLQYLDRFVELGINTVFFQVRAMGDSFYESAYEPWSMYVAGQRGKSPDYDVLRFLIDEAHARGIEFHAWLNPYRIATRTGTSQLYPTLHPSINPAWVVDHEKIQIYNPGRPEVRQRLVDIIKELLSKYNVDGIHFDDYFYPSASSAGNMKSDAADFQTYGSGFANIADWRRSNVDAAIKGVSDAIKATKPAVVFSVSPAPNHTANYNNLYADVPKWAKEGWIDVLIPQLYQEIGNQYNDFQLNLSFWTQNAGQAALMVGYGHYKFGDPTMGSAFQSTVELQRQFDLTRRNSKVVGHVMYRALTVMQNKIGITDKLADLYKHPAVTPFLGREVAPAPVKPTQVRIEGSSLKWGGVGSNRSVVYYFATKTSAGEVVAVTAENQVAIQKNGWYTVTSINADNKESAHADLIEKK